MYWRLDFALYIDRPFRTESLPGDVYLMRFGDLLRQRRKALSLTQEALAERVGLSAHFISAVENGRISDPSLSTVLAFAKGLGVEVGELLGGIAPPSLSATEVEVANLYTSAPEDVQAAVTVLLRSTENTPSSRRRSSFRLVVMVASAGGVEAVSEVLSTLPATFPLAIAVVVHRSDRSPSALSHVLDRRTSMGVRDALDGGEIAPGVVYVALPGRHLVINANETFGLSDAAKIHLLRPAGDPLFITAANVFGTRVIAVVLSGAASDGSDGIREVRRRGGATIAQSAATSENPSMPAHAVATSAVDAVLPLDKIGPELMRLAAITASTEPAVHGEG